MTNNNNKNKKKKGTNHTGTTTFIPPTINNEGVTLTTNNMQELLSYGNVKKIVELETKVDSLEKSIKDINSRIFSIRKKENRLLNRFGWTLIMANILIGILAGIIVFVFIDFVYPYLDNLLKNHQGQFWTITTISAGILIAICKLWWEVQKFAIYVKNRDQKEE